MEQNYLPLFRKYRPQSFSDIVGQESLVKALSNAIELNRIANAYLFCGPRGTGKTSTARILAKSLNCEHGPTLTPCQKCASCVDITNATGLDVIEIDAASNRGIQDAKELISQVQYAPINGKYKIFIIDEVHMLSNDAFNALLKTFEEPPKNVIFILATTEPHKVLETIISRCQRFDLRRITTQDIIKRLREISDKENIKITDEALFTIAKNVSGGLRDSLALLDQVSILGVKEEISKELIEELLGKINFDTMLDLLNSIYDENIENSLVKIETIYSKGSEPRNLAENFIEFLRNVILALDSKNEETIKNFTTLIEEDIKKIKNNERNFDKDKIIKILNTLIEYYKEIKVSTNPYLWTELAIIASCKLSLGQENIIVQNQAQTSQNASIPIAQPKTSSASAMALGAQAPIKQSAQAPTMETAQTPIRQCVQAPISQSAQAPIEQTAQAPTMETAPAQQSAQTQEPLAQEIKNPQEPQKAQKAPNTIVPKEIAQNQDSAQIWANILNAIKSIPTRALFSGVAKLVGIKENKLILGFLNDDTLTKSKSPNRFDLLKAAIEATYPNLEPEFIRINQDTKVIATKPLSTSAPRPMPQNQGQYQQGQGQNFSHPQQGQNQGQVSNSPNSQKTEEKTEETEEKKAEKKNYSPKVQDMLEQFNGRIIED